MLTTALYASACEQGQETFPSRTIRKRALPPTAVGKESPIFSNFWNWLKSLFESEAKTELAQLVTELQTNETANIAELEVAATKGSTYVVSTVTGWVTSFASKNPELEPFLPLLTDAIAGVVPGLLTAAGGDATKLYGDVLAFLTHEESVV